MEDDAPDQTDTYSGNRTRKEAERPVDCFPDRQFGIGEKHKHKGQADLSDDTGNHQIDVVAE